MQGFVDPLAVRNELTDKINTENGNHLKRVAAIQLLGTNDDTFNFQDVDKIFGINVQRVQNFSYLNGGVFKDHLIATL